MCVASLVAACKYRGNNWRASYRKFGRSFDKVRRGSWTKWWRVSSCLSIAWCNISHGVTLTMMYVLLPSRICGIRAKDTREMWKVMKEWQLRMYPPVLWVRVNFESFRALKAIRVGRIVTHRHDTRVEWGVGRNVSRGFTCVVIFLGRCNNVLYLRGVPEDGEMKDAEDDEWH